MFVMDIVSTKMTNTIETNVKSTVSINCHSEKLKCCYILQTVSLAIILQLIITIISYHYENKNALIH